MRSSYRSAVNHIAQTYWRILWQGLQLLKPRNSSVKLRCQMTTWSYFKQSNRMHFCKWHIYSNKSPEDLKNRRICVSTKPSVQKQKKNVMFFFQWGRMQCHPDSWVEAQRVSFALTQIQLHARTNTCSTVSWSHKSEMDVYFNIPFYKGLGSGCFSPENIKFDVIMARKY